MSKLEKEIKVLDIDENEIIKLLNNLNAKKVEESIQQIYVYDLPSIYARFCDCIMGLENCNEEYKIEVYRNKLKGIFFEIDNLITKEEQEKLLNITNKKYFIDLLDGTSNKDLLKVFSDEKIIEIVKRYGINPNKWVRLRKTNDKTTLTVKHILNPEIKEKIQKLLETEIEVSSIEEANELLEQLGFSFRNYQEKKRITYDLDGVEIDMDRWPLIPIYIEIEDDSEEKIKDTIKKLGLEDKKIVSCGVEDIYKKYGIDLYKHRELKF